MSNIQALSHIDQSKVAQAIKSLKNEIKYGTSDLSVNENNTANTYNNNCKNELSGKCYSFMKGTPEEKELFRVMSIDATEKIYFDSKEEYARWFMLNRKRRSKYNLNRLD